MSPIILLVKIGICASRLFGFQIAPVTSEGPFIHYFLQLGFRSIWEGDFAAYGSVVKPPRKTLKKGSHRYPPFWTHSEPFLAAKMGQDGAIGRQERPRGTKMGPKWNQDDAKTGQDGANTGKEAPRWGQDGQRGSKMGPTWDQNGVKMWLK